MGHICLCLKDIKMVKTIKLLILLLLCSFSIHNAHAAERNFPIGSFDHIRIEGNLDITITTSTGPKASAIGSKKQLNNIIFTRNGRTLKIQSQKSISPKRTKDVREPPLKIFIGARTLQNIFINGNSVVTIDKVKSKASKYIILGSGVINLNKADIGSLNMSISGGGSVNIGSGNAQKTSLEINGPGTVNAKSLITKILNITHQGPANSIITVTDRANITNNGTGRIEILGKGNCIIKSIGSGTILCENIDL